MNALSRYNLNNNRLVFKNWFCTHKQGRRKTPANYYLPSKSCAFQNKEQLLSSKQFSEALSRNIIIAICYLNRK